MRLATFVATFPFDALAHAWDLGTATGQKVTLPGPLLEEMLAARERAGETKMASTAAVA